MRTYTMRCDICGEVTTLPANEQRPEGWGTFIYRSPSQGDIEKDVCPTCAGALETTETVHDRRMKKYMDEVKPIPGSLLHPQTVSEEPAVLTGEDYLMNEGTNEE